jgi:hypothetical protein
MSMLSGFGRFAMENIDRFFDTYDRLLPQWFADAAVTVVILTAVALVIF